MKPVRLRRGAKRELAEAAAWYRERDPELAGRLLDEVSTMIATFPNIGGRVFGIDDADIRQLPVDTFPFHIVFRRRKERTTVLAIAHDRKKPDY